MKPEVYPDGFTAPDDSKFGAEAQFGAWSKFGKLSQFGALSKFGAWSLFGDKSKFGADSQFGTGVEFGDRSLFGARPRFGAGAKFGKNCIIEGVIAQRVMTLTNVDGSGRQILLVWHDDGVLVRAGCFLGTVSEFRKRATADGKYIYAAVIPAVVAAVKRAK